jgi:hypothetical protein
VVEELKAKDTLVLAGDARMDSPGHNAKYGSYTLMDTDGNGSEGNRKIVAMEMVQVTEVKNSNHLEPEGLKRCLRQVTQDGLAVPVLATDRHVMVRSIMKTEYPQTDHQFDLWHLAKSVMKKLKAKANAAACKELGPWIKNVGNHLWFCAASCQGDDKLLKEMWLSLLLHITNRHQWNANEIFHKCKHDRLTVKQVKKTKWLKTNSEAFRALQSIVTDKRLLKDLSHITKFCHTGQLEVFHSMLLKYCPKRQHFAYETMKARLMLAALDWNGQERKVVTDKEDNTIKDQIFSKQKKTWVLRNRYEIKKTHVEKLMLRVLQVKQNSIMLPPIVRPLNLSNNIATVPKPEKSEMSLRTRFVF